MIRRKEVINKQQIISEYLTGNQTFDAVGEKYGVNGRTIQSWVRAYRLQNPSVNSSEPAKETDIKLSTLAMFATPVLPHHFKMGDSRSINLFEPVILLRQLYECAKALNNI